MKIIGINHNYHHHPLRLSVLMIVILIRRHRQQRWAHGALTLIAQQTDKHRYRSHQTITTTTQ